MTDHVWDRDSLLCKRCNVQKGHQPLECFEADNVTGLSYRILKRHAELVRLGEKFTQQKDPA